MKNSHTQIKTCGWLLACIFLYTSTARAQQLTTSIPSIHTAAGRSAISEFSYSANPSLCLSLDSSFVGAMIVPSRFGMSELRYGTILAGKRLSQNFSIISGAGGLGNALYSEFSGMVGGALQIGENLVVGTTAEYSRISIQEYVPASILEVNVGATLTLSQGLTAGVAVSNILRGSYAVDSRRIHQKILIGLGVQIVPTLFIDADASISLNEYSGVTLAARYDVLPEVHCRLAVSTSPRTAELSVALCPLPSIAILATGHYHDVLGISEQVGVVWYW
ncbi:MAG: hypothetical protein IPM69_03600 [Ignavibacteria bacterium]|nr:hypothetical protein [Ignavibacteria bacterium]